MELHEVPISPKEEGPTFLENVVKEVTELFILGNVVAFALGITIYNSSPNEDMEEFRNQLYLEHMKSESPAIERTVEGLFYAKYAFAGVGWLLRNPLWYGLETGFNTAEYIDSKIEN